LQQQGAQQLLRRDRGTAFARVKPRKARVQLAQHIAHKLPDLSQRMVRPHPRLRRNVRKQPTLIRKYPPHASLRRFVIKKLNQRRLACGGYFRIRRSEEHTSELQSLTNLVCRLLLEKKKKPRQLLMDHGTPWWNNNNGWGLSGLSVFLMEQDIELIFGRVAHPQTQGKVERFHRTLHRSMIHQGLPQKWEPWQEGYAEFVERYNKVRPHEGLGMKRPADCYRRSPRLYRPQVQAWPYPAGLEIKRVDANGMIRLEGQRFFVCEALVHREVAVERIGSNALVS